MKQNLIRLKERFGGGSAHVRGDTFSPTGHEPLFHVHEMTKGKPDGPRYYHITHIPTGCWVARYKRKSKAIDDIKLLLSFIEGVDLSFAYATDARILSASPFYNLGLWLKYRGSADCWSRQPKLEAVELAFAARKLEQLKQELGLEVA